MLQILECGRLNTVQDLGRFGVRRLGVGVAGPMDPVSFRISNILVGNKENEAGLEIQTYPFEVKFLKEGRVAVTGSSCAFLDEIELPAFWSGFVEVGQVLRVELRPPGSRSYISVAGGINVPSVLGSKSTQLRGGFGGNGGRELSEGDCLEAGRPLCPDMLRLPDFGAELPCVTFPVPYPSEGADHVVRALRGGEYELFTAEAQSSFWSSLWTVTLLSNRTGYRLEGVGLPLSQAVEMRSHGVIPGVVQVPPAGQPIIQMMDGNTVGGYPKIAHVIDADMWRIGQASAGQKIRFVEVSHQEAVAETIKMQNYFKMMALNVSRVVSFL